MLKYDVLVIGGGVAGMRAALAAGEGTANVAIISKTHPLRSNSGVTQSCVNAALGNSPKSLQDNPEFHGIDTYKTGDALGEGEAIKLLTEGAIPAVIEIENWGLPFSRDANGKIAQCLAGGSRYPRACYGHDRTGLYMLQTLYEQVCRRDIRVYEEWMAIGLVIDMDRCEGVIVYDIYSGELHGIEADTVILATGGVGRCYSKTTNGRTNSAYSLTLALDAGCELRDLEFIQFHPTTFTGKNCIIPELVQIHGGKLINNEKEPFMKHYFSGSVKDIAPQYLASRAIIAEIKAGRGINEESVYLDLTALEEKFVQKKLPMVSELSVSLLGKRPTRRPIAVEPAQHFSIGGVAVEVNGATRVKRLYAVGECACSGVHGACVMEGNALAEAIVYGKRVGEAALQDISDVKSPKYRKERIREALRAKDDQLRKLFSAHGEENPYEIKAEMEQIMTEFVGPVRNNHDLKFAHERLCQLQDRMKRLRPATNVKRYNYDKINILELYGDLRIAKLITRTALTREESRGCHYREDFPDRDDRRFQKHSILVSAPDDKMKVDYIDTLPGDER